MSVGSGAGGARLDDGLDVVGGAHGVDADTDDMDATGASVAALGLDVGEVAVRSHRYLLDANLLSSAPFSPGTFVGFETSLLGALDGPGGLSANAVRMTGAGAHMRATALAYRATDRALQWHEDLTQHLQGYLVAWQLTNPVTGIPLAGATAYDLWREGFFDDPQAWLTAHPDEVEELVASSSGFLDFFLPGVGFPGSVEEGAALLALLYDQDGRLSGPPTEAEGDAPLDLLQAMGILDVVGDEADQFRIERVPGDPPTYNVYLPGTKVFDAPLPPGGPLPDVLEQSDVVQNLGTNFAAVSGEDNAYVASVIAALEEAGVPPDASIALYGHSQGGIVAARVAEAVTRTDSPTPYHVTHVVTAGSPVDHIDLPGSVHVLSLVNEHDIVPRLDGADYDDTSNHTTVVTRYDSGSIGGNHAMISAYLPMVEQMQASTDPAVRDELAALAGFHPGGRSQSWTFGMQR